MFYIQLFYLSVGIFYCYFYNRFYICFKNFNCYAVNRPYTHNYKKKDGKWIAAKCNGQKPEHVGMN